nr:unnamed protein product [Callosobruchus chinensis]
MKLECFVIVLTIYLLEKFMQRVESVNLDLDANDDSGYFNKCFEEIGCVEADSRWFDKKLRPVNMVPSDRHVIKTDFLLIKEDKRDHLDDDYEGLLYTSITADAKSLKSSGFKKSSDLMLLIHDFTSNGYTGWVKNLAKVAFGQSEDFNIISVDWQRGAEPPYDLAISNGRVVALEVIFLLKELKEKFNYTLDGVHIVGHGVGAHIAGYVGATYNDIRKITGLDPSGPRFDGMPDVVKLNPTNARYVEIIHTDAYNENNTFDDVVTIERNQLSHGEILPGCSHKRSFKYFIESLMHRNCTFLGIRCNNYEDFSDGKCTSCEETDSCRTFGAKSYPHSLQKTIYYLDTADDSPFCMFVLKISVSVKIDKERDGYFEFILVDDSGNIAEAVPSYKKEYKPIKDTSSNTFLYFAHPPQLGAITEARVKWNERKKLYCLVYCDQHIDVERVEVEPVLPGKQKREASILCPPPEGTKIENGAYKSFSKCDTSSKVHLSSSTPGKPKNVTFTAAKGTEKHTTAHISSFPHLTSSTANMSQS